MCATELHFLQLNILLKEMITLVMRNRKNVCKMLTNPISHKKVNF